MATIGLVACVSKKQPHPCPACELYESPLFKKARQYIEGRCKSWFILSARHGLVPPEQIIAPYEDTLNRKTIEERRIWTGKVWTSLSEFLMPGDRVIVLAGNRYREFLVSLIEKHHCTVDIPMAGLSIGRQLQWLTQRLNQPEKHTDLERLYALLETLEEGLGGKRLMSECNGRQDWPKRGIYFFYEPGETRGSSREGRVVRVGTHAVSRGSKSTLWQRLIAHRGTKAGLGNHRGSIFRLHVGAAVARRETNLAVATWGIGQSADRLTRDGEKDLEYVVSKHIGAMQILWLGVDDEPGKESDRAYLERNLISLLAQEGRKLDQPSLNWLGVQSPDERIRNSGLWNLDHLGFQYDSSFLDQFQRYLDTSSL